jgi:hypothetical protein
MPAKYSITIQSGSEDSITLLKLGEPYRSQLKSGSSQTYSFIFEEQGDINIVGTPLSGDIFVSVSTQKNGSAKWTAKANEPVFIRKTDPNYLVGRNYYVTVQASSESTYTISVLQDTSFMYLPNGVPVSSTFNNEDNVMHYMFMLPDTKFRSSIIFSTLTSNFIPEVYIRKVNLKTVRHGRPPFPNKSTYWRSFTNYDNDLKMLKVEIDDINDSTNALTISVYAKPILGSTD